MARLNGERRPAAHVLAGRHVIRLDWLRMPRGDLFAAIDLEPRGEPVVVGSGSIAALIRELRRVQLALEEDALRREAEPPSAAPEQPVLHVSHARPRGCR